LLVGSSWYNPIDPLTNNGTSLVDKLGDILFDASLVS
jgi:hypothetical protein